MCSICSRDLQFSVVAAGILDSVIGDGRNEVDAHTLLMFMSIRAPLRNGGMPGCESDYEAGHVMALLNA